MDSVFLEKVSNRPHKIRILKRVVRQDNDGDEIVYTYCGVLLPTSLNRLIGSKVDIRASGGMIVMEVI